MEDKDIRPTPEEKAANRKPFGRAQMRARTRRVEKALRKALPKEPKGPMVLVEAHGLGEGRHVIHRPGRDPLELGDPLSITVDEDGRHVLDGPPTTSMLISHSMLRDVGKEWHATQAAIVRRSGWRDALEISHSEGVLVYSLHSMGWTDEGPEQAVLLAILMDQRDQGQAKADQPKKENTTHVSPK